VDEKRDREISRARPKAAPETVLKEVDKQLHPFGLEIIKYDVGDSTVVWKITHRP
jgi:hypothetical protein